MLNTAVRAGPGRAGPGLVVMELKFMSRIIEIAYDIHKATCVIINGEGVHEYVTKARSRNGIFVNNLYKSRLPS